MGAAVSIELSKPLDASDIRITNDLSIAKTEIIRLRTNLGHLATHSTDKCFSQLCLDANDLCLGVDEKEDFERCVEGIAHIRKALNFSTQRSRRQTRFGSVEISASLLPPVIDSSSHRDDSDDSDTSTNDDLNNSRAESKASSRRSSAASVSSKQSRGSRKSFKSDDDSDS